MIKVLIVEDDPMVAQINKRYIESMEEFKVVNTLSNGEEALKYLKTNIVDLIILDVYMPKFDGIKLLQEMRRNSIMSDVILVTAAKEVGIIDEALTLGAIDYLIKPFEYERLKKSLENYLSRYRLMNAKEVFGQEDIDKITNQGNTALGGELQKGLHQKTLMRVREFMRNNNDNFLTSEEVAERMRVSRVTTRRYLEFLVSIGELVSEVEYGSIGRPSHLYKYTK
jgi:response regulator of citrate/malate metabolism